MAIRITRKPPKPKPGVIDDVCVGCVQKAPNAIIAWWLIASYVYYAHDLSLLSDELYDQMAREMKECWNELQHPHKHLITAEHLDVGSLYDVPAEAYPLMTRAAAAHLTRTAWGISIEIGAGLE